MKARLFLLPILLTALAGCTPMPLTPADVEARKIEAVPDKAVIYLVRDNPDHNGVPATLLLGDRHMITTYPGTYYRWEVEPGRHTISGFAADHGSISLDVEAGRIYFVQQWTRPWISYAVSYFYKLPESRGREIVTRSVMIGG